MDELFDANWTHIRITRREAVCEVALARPQARNALNGELMAELTEAAHQLRLRTDVLAVILTGTPDYFSAGADLSASQARAGEGTLLEARRAIMAGPDLCKAWDEIEAVTIAAIEGYCIGGASALHMDVPPYVMGSGNPCVPFGVNVEGLRRRGFSPESIAAIRDAYKILYRRGLKLDEARAELRARQQQEPGVAAALESLLAFLDSSERGIIRP